jgi:WD40 repeat protein
MLATGDWGRNIRIWDVASWQELAAPQQTVGQQTWGVAFSPDGRWFAACGDGGGVLLWRIDYRAASGEQRSRLSLESPIRLSNQGSLSLTFSPDSRRLAWVELPGLTVHLWDVVAARHLASPPTRLVEGIHSLGFLSDSTSLALIATAGVPEGWDVATGRRIFICESPPFEEREGRRLNDIVALSADTRWLAQGGAAVQVWDLEHRSLLLTLPQERSLPWCFAWSPGKELLAVGSSDGALVIWNLPSIRSQLAQVGLSW